MNKIRHKIREFFCAVRLRDLWIVNGKIKRLEDRCTRLEYIVKELNPGLRFIDDGLSNP